MGEANRRGTFEQRRQESAARRAAVLAARPSEPQRPIAAVKRPRRNIVLMALAAMAGQKDAER